MKFSIKLHSLNIVFLSIQSMIRLSFAIISNVIRFSPWGGRRLPRIIFLFFLFLFFCNVESDQDEICNSKFRELDDGRFVISGPKNPCTLKTLIYPFFQNFIRHIGSVISKFANLIGDS